MNISKYRVWNLYSENESKYYKGKTSLAIHLQTKVVNHSTALFLKLICMKIRISVTKNRSVKLQNPINTYQFGLIPHS